MHVNSSLKMAIGTPAIELNDWATINYSGDNKSEINFINCLKIPLATRIQNREVFNLKEMSRLSVPNRQPKVMN